MKKVKILLIEIEAIFNRSGLTANIEMKESNTFFFCIMLGLYGGEDLDVIFINTIIFFSKWEIWKIHLNNFINIYNAHYSY